MPKLPSWLHIFLFDTELLIDDAGNSNISGDPKQEEVARKYLCNPKRKGWKLAMGHHPFLTFGPRGTTYAPRNKNDMDAMAKFIHPILKDCKVDIYFSGHDHVQEHISTPHFELIVQGGGSEANSLWKTNEPPLYFSSLFQTTDSYSKKYVKGKELGFSIIKASKHKIEVNFFKVPKDGSNFSNTYTYKKDLN